MGGSERINDFLTEVKYCLGTAYYVVDPLYFGSFFIAGALTLAVLLYLAFRQLLRFAVQKRNFKADKDAV